MLEKYVKKLFEREDRPDEKKIDEVTKNLFHSNADFFFNYIRNLGNLVLFTTDRDFVIKDANKAFRRLVNLEDVSEKSLKIFLPPYVKNLPIPENGKFEKLIIHLKCRKPDVNIALEGYVFGTENLLIFLLEKRYFIYHELIEKISDLNNEVAKLSREGQKKDILIESLKKELRETLRKDLLTGVFNRIYLKEVLEREIGKKKRYKLSISVVLIDIDNFKTINQNYGRSTGDKILKQLAKILEENTRMVDMVFRIEEDNFLILLPNTDIEGAETVAKKVKNILNSTLFENNISIIVNTVAYECSSEDTLESIIDRVYKALYQTSSI